MLRIQQLRLSLDEPKEMLGRKNNKKAPVWELYKFSCRVLFLFQVILMWDIM